MSKVREVNNRTEANKDEVDFFINMVMEHKEKVAANLNVVIADLSHRALVHDNDKLIDKRQFPLMSRYYKDARKFKYDSPEYKVVNARMKPAMKIHLSTNGHHKPTSKRYKDSNLMDVLEMLTDWIGAMESQGINTDDEIIAGVEYNISKYDLHHIDYLLINTTKDILNKRK